MRAWLQVPYLIETPDGVVRRLAIDDWTDEITASGGHWSESEINGGDLDNGDGGSALVLVRATPTLINDLNREFSVVEDTRLVWPEGGLRRAPNADEWFSVRPLSEVSDDVWDEDKKTDRLALVEQLITQADRDGYVKLTGLPWAEAAQILVILGRSGYGLDRVSTGTFPTTSVLTNFTGTDEDPLSQSGMFNTTTFPPGTAPTANLKRVSNKAENAFTSIGGSFTTTSYGPNSEAYVVVSTKSDNQYVWTRIQAGDTNDGYQIRADSSNNWYVRRLDNDTATVLGAAASQGWANGDSLGLESLGNDHSGYLYASSSWSLVLTRNDSTYSGAGYIGIGGGSASFIADDMGGGTIISASLKGTLALTGAGV